MFERNSKEDRSRNNNQTFFKNVKRLTKGFKSGASSRRDERGNLVTDVQGVLRLWRYHFSTLLRGEGDTNAATREDSKPVTIDDYGVETPPPSHNKVRVAIQRRKNKKGTGPDSLPAELFKAAGDDLQNLAGRKHAQQLEP